VVLKVVDAVEKRPFENPIVVEVALNPAPAVNGKVPLTGTAPVAPEIVIPDPATRDVTPEFVTFPFEYDKPLENVVVAPVYTRPFASTASPPADRDGRRRLELNVEDAVEKIPFENPIVVEVAL
jgi:hypothetical protein